MFRTVCGGGKGGGSSYDPQIGVAAGQSAAVAARAQAFAETYYNDVVTPMLQQQNDMAADQISIQRGLADQQGKYMDAQGKLMDQQGKLAEESAAAGRETQAKLNQSYDLNNEQMRLASDRYKRLGIPAEDAYYKMVSDYSSPGEEERQARLAKGDVGLAASNQKGAFLRSLSSLGVSATSPAALSAMSDMAVQNAAMEAGAATRARGAAKALGMTLTSDAANFGRGGTSNVLAFGNAAQGNTTGAFGTANSALGGVTGALNGAGGAIGTMSGAFGASSGVMDAASRALASTSAAGNGMNAAFNTAVSGYGQNLDAYTKLGSADIQAKAANDPMAGIGKRRDHWLGGYRRGLVRV